LLRGLQYGVLLEDFVESLTFIRFDWSGIVDDNARAVTALPSEDCAAELRLERIRAARIKTT
jgi:hypothetical protein